MKPTITNRSVQLRAALVVIALTIAIPSARAATAASTNYWDNNGGTPNDWGSLQNWNMDGTIDGGAPSSLPGSSNEVRFSHQDLNGVSQTVNLNGNRSALRVNVWDANVGTTTLLGGGTDSTLALAVEDGTWGLMASSTNVFTVGSATAGQAVNIAMAGDQIWEVRNTGGFTIKNTVSTTNTSGVTIAFTATNRADNGTMTVEGNIIGDIRLTITGTNSAANIENARLVLSGTNTFTGDVKVKASAVLKVTKPEALPDTLSLRLQATGSNRGKVDLSYTGERTIKELLISGNPVAEGTWGFTGSGADNISTVYFTGGTGVLRVASSFIVTYNANGADSGTVPADQTKTNGVTLTLAGNTGGLAKTGFSFAGWNTAADGTGTDYAEGASYTANAAVTLYAKWTTAPTYTVSYNANGADSGTEPVSQTKVQDVPLTLASNSGNLAKTGYSFGGWNTQADGSGTDYAQGASYTANASVTLYAKWIPAYTISYDANGATSGTAPASQTKAQDVPLTLASNSGNLAKTGYSFVGWNTQADGTGTDYAEGASYTANAAVTLYAKWTALPTYTVSYNANGATSGTVPADQTKTNGVALTLASNTGGLAKTGSTFLGWNTAADGTGTDYAEGASYTANAPVTLYAKWSAAPTYTVSYNANGATSGTVPASQTKIQDVPLTLASNSGNLAKTGYSFVGWNTQANGSGTDYAQGASYTANASVTLYAKWSDLLLAWWKFDETSGTTAADSSGNGNAGTLNNFPASPWAAGKIGNCLTFDGTDDFVVKDPLSASISGECTASVWMKKSAASAAVQRLFDVAVSAGAGLNVCVAATSGNVIMLTQGGLTTQLNTTTSVTDGNWHHIAATRSGSAPYTFKIYVDGVLRATDSAANNTLPALTRLFAGSKRGTQERFGGQLDDLRVYGRVLSATEIQALASSAVPPTLTIARQGTQVQVSWTPAGGRLESSPVLGPGASWTTVGTDNPASVGIAGAATYFRVVNP